MDAGVVTGARPDLPSAHDCRPAAGDGGNSETRVGAKVQVAGRSDLDERTSGQMATIHPSETSWPVVLGYSIGTGRNKAL